MSFEEHLNRFRCNKALIDSLAEEDLIRAELTLSPLQNRMMGPNKILDLKSIDRLYKETMRALILISLPGLILLISVWLIGPSAIWFSVLASGLTILGFKKFDALRLKEKLIGIWKWPTGSDRQQPQHMRRFGMQFFPATA
jgi:hypothetical protein